MKKLLIYTALAWAAISAASCVQPLTPEQKAAAGSAGLNLSVSCVSPATKAEPIPGVEDYHENKISHIDYFVFTSNDDNAQAVEHGREEYTDRENVTESFTVKSLNMENYVNPATQTMTGYVYVIANLPAEYSHHTTQGIQYTAGGSTSTIGLKLGDLKSLELTTAFNILDSNGKILPQNDFVMASDIETFTLTATARQATVTAELARVASKITLDLNIVSAIDEIVARMSGRDTLFEEYVTTWYPDVNNMKLYLSYANSRTTVDRTLFGTAPHAYDNTHFFSYDRDGFTPDIELETNGWNVTGTPFYTYPMRWNAGDAHAPFIKLILPWRSYVEEDVVYHEHPYITHGEGGGTHPGNKLFSVSRNHINDQTAQAQEFFYKILIPVDANMLNSNTWYKITLDVSILGSSSDDLSLEVAGQYHVVNWSDSDFSAGGNLVQGSYLKLASNTYYIYGGDAIEIPVLSSHDIATTVTGVSFMDYSQTPNPVLRTNFSYLARQPFTADYDRSRFVFTHELMTDVASATTSNKPDVAEYTFTVRVANTAGLWKDITIVQRPPLMIQHDKNSKVNNSGGVYVNYYTYGYGAFANTYNGYTYAPSSYSRVWIGGVQTSLGSGANSNPNMYVISTAAAPSATSLIADPRSTTVDNNLGSTDNDWASPQGYAIGTDTQRRILYYHPADDSEAGINKIAPKFRIASSYGRISRHNGKYLDYHTAQKRCASYQEDGIPAGRWRIPTKAEMEFIIRLSNIEVIPSLFSPTEYSYNGHTPNYYEAGYWTADGGVIYPWTNGVVGYLNQTEFAYHSSLPSDDSGYAMPTNGVRCVYDEWFWGTEDRLTDRTRFTWGDRPY